MATEGATLRPSTRRERTIATSMGVDNASWSVGTRLEHRPHGGSCVCVYGSELAIVVREAQHDSHVASGGLTSKSAKQAHAPGAFAPRDNNAPSCMRGDRYDFLL